LFVRFNRTPTGGKSLLPAACLAITALMLGGCSAAISTTDVAADATRSVAKGVLASSRGTTDASVTEPNTPRYQQTVAFVDSQRDPLRREAATGQGENIDSLARLLDTRSTELGRWMQANYDNLFTDAHDAEAIVARLHARHG
jgi:hypothetical protein|tara:strand:- start:946 stop:1374 length:429 start_codon:yes stop_codon:yes gene_type:complete